MTGEGCTLLYTAENNIDHSLHPESIEKRRRILERNHQIVEKWEEIKFIEVGKRVKLPSIRKNCNAREFITISNKALSEIKKQHQLDITQINELMYATAAVVTESSDLKLKKQRKPGRTQRAWKEDRKGNYSDAR